jgi:hypothetical protein
LVRRNLCHAFALLLAALSAAGCYRVEDTRWTAAQKQTGPAVAKEAVAGSKLNKFFPKAEGDWDVVFQQEKQGTAIAKLTKGGKDMATLAVVDTVSDPSVADEYKGVADKLDAYPTLAKGNLGTAVLVGDRYQVTVRTAPSASFSEDDRKEWIKKFDLAGLATLQ